MNDESQTQTTQSTWAVRRLTVVGFDVRSLAAPASVGWCRLRAAPGASLQAQTSTGQGAGAPGTPGRQAAVHRAVFQRAVPPAMFTDTAGKDT